VWPHVAFMFSACKGKGFISRVDCFLCFVRFPFPFTQLFIQNIIKYILLSLSTVFRSVTVLTWSLIPPYHPRSILPIKLLVELLFYKVK
jgi:hypothetical protein